jgi:hypothetical protein
MTIERDFDPDATVKMPLPIPEVEQDLEDFDPERTLVREEWQGVHRLPPRK